MLVLTRKPEQSIMVGADIEIMILEVRGEQVRVGIRAPRAVAIHRKEVFDQIREANLLAADGGPEDLIELTAILPNAEVRQAPQPADQRDPP
ncbi:MAG TPA: carbon storage regulator CsrA [Chthonomonadales bacterium]|nr:carbon storage regulator CsrA [Chthonomonadales bacterium]